eukprot:scaffold2058_cov115-Isochrysis_galbana.AAC.1
MASSSVRDAPASRTGASSAVRSAPAACQQSSSGTASSSSPLLTVLVQRRPRPVSGKSWGSTSMRAISQLYHSRTPFPCNTVRR